METKQLFKVTYREHSGEGEGEGMSTVTGRVNPDEGGADTIVRKENSPAIIKTIPRDDVDHVQAI